MDDLIQPTTTSSSTTFHRQNPNFFFLDKPFPSVHQLQQQPQPEPERAFVTIFTSPSFSRRFFIDRADFPRRPSVNDLPLPQFRQFRPARVEEDDASFGGMFDSLRDRTKDVLSVVVALLFGVGCGALTAGTMYLAFSIIKAFYHPRRFNNYYDSDSEEDEEEDVTTPKKVGYVMIPSAAPAKQVDIAIPPSGNKD